DSTRGGGFAGCLAEDSGLGSAGPRAMAGRASRRHGGMGRVRGCRRPGVAIHAETAVVDRTGMAESTRVRTGVGDRRWDAARGVRESRVDWLRRTHEVA